jgi:ferredoxin
MRVELQTEKCQGHGQCVMAAPEFFAFNDQGFAVLTSSDVPAELEEKAQAAELRCPERAITTS